MLLLHGVLLLLLLLLHRVLLALLLLQKLLLLQALLFKELLLLLDLLIAGALRQLIAGATLLHLLRGLGADIHGADGLAVRVQSRTRVLALVSGSDGPDE